MSNETLEQFKALSNYTLNCNIPPYEIKMSHDILGREVKLTVTFVLTERDYYEIHS